MVWVGDDYPVGVRDHQGIDPATLTPKTLALLAAVVRWRVSHGGAMPEDKLRQAPGLAGARPQAIAKRCGRLGNLVYRARRGGAFEIGVRGPWRLERESGAPVARPPVAERTPAAEGAEGHQRLGIAPAPLDWHAELSFPAAGLVVPGRTPPTNREGPRLPAVGGWAHDLCRLAAEPMGAGPVDDPDAFERLGIKWKWAMVAGQLDDALAAVDQMVTLALAQADESRREVWLAIAEQARCPILTFAGRFADALQSNRVALARARGRFGAIDRWVQIPSFRASALCDGGRAVFFLGHPEAAQRMIERALAEALATEARLGAGPVPSTDAMFALFNLALLGQKQGQPAAVRQHAQALLARSEGRALHFEHKARLLLGWAEVEVGLAAGDELAAERGFAAQGTARAALEAINARIGRIAGRVLAGAQRLRQGRLDQAAALLEIPVGPEEGVLYFEPERQRVLARLRVRQGRLEAARACALAGMALAIRQGARWHQDRLLAELDQLGRAGRGVAQALDRGAAASAPGRTGD